MSKLNCRGIGVVIDDKLPLSDGEQVDDAIGEIVRQLKGDGIPLLRYRELPPESEWNNFGEVAFVLVDWSLINPKGVAEEVSDEDDSSSDVDVDNELMATQICRFIKTVHSKAFVPIFVFSNQEETEIKSCLKSNGIEVDVPNAYVLVRPKSEMNVLEEGGVPKLFNEINKWIQATPAINLFTTWGNDVLSARNQMFAEFYDKSHNWPSLLWKAYRDDNDDPVHGLSQVMFDNLKARVKCSLAEMPEANIGRDDTSALMDVLALTVMLPSGALPNNQIGCGDLFEIEADEKGKRYDLVVSCDCDCVVRPTGTTSYIQVLRVCHPIARDDAKITERISPKRGFNHRATESYVFPIDGQCFRVDYRSFHLIQVADFNLEKRKGRILPPYITDIRQRLAQWNQRVGFPKLPSELFN